jgi:hypothetical protein
MIYFPRSETFGVKHIASLKKPKQSNFVIPAQAGIHAFEAHTKYSGLRPAPE